MSYLCVRMNSYFHFLGVYKLKGSKIITNFSVSLCEPLTQLSAVKVSSTNRMARSD